MTETETVIDYLAWFKREAKMPLIVYPHLAKLLREMGVAEELFHEPKPIPIDGSIWKFE